MNNSTKKETDFLTYVLYVLKDSRTKKRAEARIHGLIGKRLESLNNCISFTEEMINDYIAEKEKEIKEQIPQTPLMEIHQSNGERIKKS